MVTHLSRLKMPALTGSIFLILACQLKLPDCKQPIELISNTFLLQTKSAFLPPSFLWLLCGAFQNQLVRIIQDHINLSRYIFKYSKRIPHVETVRMHLKNFICLAGRNKQTEIRENEDRLYRH